MSDGADWSEKSDKDLARAWLVNGMLLALARCADEHDPEVNIFARTQREIQDETLRRAKGKSDATTR